MKKTMRRGRAAGVRAASSGAILGANATDMPLHLLRGTAQAPVVGQRLELGVVLRRRILALARDELEREEVTDARSAAVRVGAAARDEVRLVDVVAEEAARDADGNGVRSL